MAATSAAAEELPLLIQDYSCANSFEEHVRMIEAHLTSLFDSEPLLQSFLVSHVPSSKPSRASPGYGSEHGGGDDKDSSDNDTSSLVSFLDEDANGNKDGRNPILSNVFSQTMTLYAPPPSPTGESPQLDLDLSVAVEVHVRDAAHSITQQYCTPLFFLIRKVAASASYRESETNYLLSLLSTAVRQVLRQQQNGAVLRIGTAITNAAALSGPVSGAATPPIVRSSQFAAEALPSPFSFPDGCAPCFAPAGDSYKQSFVGVAPPLPSIGTLPPPPSTMTAAEWALLHQRTFTTRFLSDAFAHPSEHCRTLSEFIDLFQLHVGQHSRIRSDDFEGICVSLREAYALPIPWKFHPYGPPPTLSDAAGAAKKSKSSNAKEAAASALTWEAVLERENTYTQLLSGGFTHTFGTAVPPLKHVLFHFQWNQLQDVEAHEPSGRGGHLDPFQFAAAGAVPLSTAAQAAQRKCWITAQAVVRSDEHLEGGGVGERLRAIVMERFLDPLASRVTLAPTAAATAQPPKSQTTRTARPGDGSENALEAATRDDAGDDADNQQLHELAACIVEWRGSNVSLQESLLCRFASPCYHETVEDGGECEHAAVDDADDEGCEGRTRGGAMAAAAERGAIAVARRLRNLWDEWEAHQLLFPAKAATLLSSNRGSSSSNNNNSTSTEASRAQSELQLEQHATSTEDAEREAAAVATAIRPSRDKRRQARLEGGGGSTAAPANQKDLRVDYFPESFIARFAYACATQVQSAGDALTLWQLCLDRLKSLLLVADNPSTTTAEDQEQSRKKSWQQLLDCLALPRADPPVDLGRPLLSQKLQLLRFALSSLLRPTDDPWSNYYAAGVTPLPPTADGDAEDEDVGDASPSPAAELRLITNGEVLVAPAPLPTPPTTSDEVLRRAMELNTLGAAAVEKATTSWLHGDALYNDMCLFLYVNHAQDGHVVRFPDFVHWHSPRDFVSLPPPTSREAASQHSDSDYLSDRMKSQLEGGRGSSHVWWALWSRAVPRSREEIVRTLFQPYEEATRVLEWLAALPETTLLLELCNACVSNALHQLLCHRFLLGDAGAHAVGSGSIPASPRLRPLHHYIQEKCASLTKDLEAASSIFSSRAETTWSGGSAGGSSGPPFQGASAMEAVELEMLRTFMANAFRELGEIEVSLCTAIAVHYLLGFTTDEDAAATVRALCAPFPPSQQQPQSSDSSCSSNLPMRTVTVSKSAWTACFMRQFVRPESRVVQERMVRLTCMAERPLNTCSCFQQLMVHQDTTQILRMALALTREVL